MSTLIAGTTAASMDEPCLLLKEEHLQAPDSKGWRRVQTLVVMRGDAPAELRRDLGPAAAFHGVQQFRIPGGAFDGGKFYIEHTVGELVDIADTLRAGAIRPPDVAPSDLIGGYHDHMEQKALARLRRSSFGAHQRTERSY